MMMDQLVGVRNVDGRGGKRDPLWTTSPRACWGVIGDTNPLLIGSIRVPATAEASVAG